jgi:RimJ/RimL family protein N-acetyltransferase
MKISLGDFNKKLLPLTKKWLEDEEIRRLTNTPVFSEISQLEWFRSLGGKTDYKIWSIKVNNIPVGACGLKNITPIDCEYWGYVGEKDYWGKGIGKKVLDIIEKKAKKLNLESIWLQVLENNERAISLYQKKGFTKVSNQNRMITMRKLI